MKIIMECIFGSRLYGINSEFSDRDFKGIFLPDKEQLFLGKIPESIHKSTKQSSETKNSSDDVDTEIYSLQYFIQLACEGQTAALDMLHGPESMLLETSDIWREIVANRHRFYTKNLRSFVGYARKQSSKYGIKGSRLNDAKRVIDFVDNILNMNLYSMRDLNDLKLKDVWNNLPEGEHINKHPASEEHGNIRMYEVCGRKICETAKLVYLKEVVGKFHQSYGERAQQAAENKGIDWKACSHALRAAFQTKEILTKGEIKFPLQEAEYLKQVKAGKLDWLIQFAPRLEELMDEVEALSKESNLPEVCDRKYWDKFIIKTMEKEFGRSNCNDCL